MKLIIEALDVKQQFLTLSLEVRFADCLPYFSPKLSLVFDNGRETRRIPFPCAPYQAGSGELAGVYTYDLSVLFWEHCDSKTVTACFLLALGEKEHQLSAALPSQYVADCFTIEQGECLTLHQIKPFSFHPLAALGRFFKSSRHDQAKVLVKGLLSLVFLPFRLCRVRSDRVTFCSNRRADLTGNPACVYNRLVQDGCWDLRLHFNNGRFGRYDLRSILRFFYLYATSRVVLVDDYYHFVSYVKKPKGVRLIQLWHACGAFKTFGFSRLGKDSKLTQYAENHRQYDAALVSGSGVRGCYQEGFGLSLEKVLATGVPRTDLLLDTAYRQNVEQAFYERYPVLKGKKILLFAPTFRGGGKGNAYYPLDRFDPMALCDALGEEYAVVIKFHPYLSERYLIPASYAARVVDCSAESELNDLLFVSDLVITDYSSVVFEAAILALPMLFYAYDLEDYIASRDFYVEFSTFIPGVLVQKAAQLPGAVRQALQTPADLSHFRRRYLDAADGQATERAAELVRKYLKNEG